MVNKMLNTSYNNIIDALKCVCFNHGMVNNVSSGNIEDIDLAANSVYPLVHIVPGNVVAGVQSITFSFNLLAMDLVHSDNSNEQQVLSDTLQILLDVIAQYKNGLQLGVQQNEGIFGQLDNANYTLEPFLERFDNAVAGFNLTLSIIVPATYFACDSFNLEAQYGGGWIWGDNGQINCMAANNTPAENTPTVMPEEQI